MLNFLTKEVATVSGVIFTFVLFAIFYLTERRQAPQGQGRRRTTSTWSSSTRSSAEQITVGDPGPDQAVSQARGDPLAAQPRDAGEVPGGDRPGDDRRRGHDGQRDPPAAAADLHPSITEPTAQLLTAVVNLAEHAGKPVQPLIVPTNEPFFALARTAKDDRAQELIMGASNKFDPNDQLDQVALYWLNLDGQGKTPPLTIRVLGKDRDVRLDIAGGSQIPGLGARRPRRPAILADLRESWRGVERLLLAYDGSPLSADFLDTVLSFLDPAIAVTLIDVVARPRRPATTAAAEAQRESSQQGVDRAASSAATSSIGRGHAASRAREIVQAAVEGKFDAIFMSLRGEYRRRDTDGPSPNTRYVLRTPPAGSSSGFAPKSIPQAKDPAPTRSPPRRWHRPAGH